uniref:Large ribosomal subunit protein uL13c n=1 Tax=Psammoneis obaidii TaxID=1706219 RepID=A0A2U9NRT2_9STRA|nr:ribosomal protein L13 [Psammoneis obaidii]AWT39844.1 ribosomal protein L13 [Psammoneis obaidii]
MNSLNKTFLPSEKYENRKWFIIDCKGQKLGRLATQVVHLLKGKGKPHYYPSVDIGDYVILINADLIILKENIEKYTVYNPGRPGSSLKRITESLPSVAIERAIKGMLSNSETRKYFKRLNIYNTQDHPHQAQNTIEFSI